MQLIPLSSFISIFNAVIALFCASLMFIRKRGLLFQNILASRLFIVFVISAITFSVAGLPGTLVKDPSKIQMVYTFVDVFTMLNTICLVFIPLSVFSKGKPIAFQLLLPLITFSIGYLIHNLLFVTPATPVVYGPFIDWRGSSLPIFQNAVAGIAMFCIATTVFLFTKNGWFHENDVIRRRSRFMGSGFFLILIGWALISLFTVSSGSKMLLIISGGAGGSLLMSGGFLLLLKGVFEKESMKRL